MYSIGLDVSKSTINCYIPNEEIDLAIDNNEKSLNQFYLKLKKIYKKDIDKIVFIFEPTGSYSITSPINNLNYSIILYGKNRCKKIITQRVV